MPSSVTMDFTFLQPFADNPGSTILGVIIIYLLWKIYNKPRNLPPGPKPWPLIGNLNYFRDDELRYRDYERLGREYGDVAMLYFGRRKHIVLNKWNVIKEAFVTRGLDFQDRDPALLGNDYEDFFDEVFNCPLSDDWQWKKKFALKALKNAGFGTKASEEKIIREVNELLSWIENHNGKSFDIEDALVNLHANVILSVLISKRYPWFTKGVERMIAAGREFYEVTQVCTSLTLDLAPQYIPMWLVKLIFRSRLMKHVYGGFENSRSIVYEAIAEKRNEQLDPQNPRDFLEAYMTQREDFDEKVFTSTVCIFMPDAIDSLSSLGLWILLYLAYNPDVQKKCQAEIDEVCGTRQPHLADRSDLNWVEASILEGTRLGTPLPISLAHIVTKNTKLRGYTIPRKNTCVIANLYAGNRDPEVFPDPEKFYPTRFLDEHGKFHRADHVVSYGIGKRMCVGKAMSEVELFLIISNILQRYNVSFPQDQPNPSTVSMKGNLFRRPHPYKLVATLR